MVTILLVRHGTTAATGTRLGGWTDAHLDDRGVAQVEATAARLAELDVTNVYSSPIVRTQDTARIIARACGLRVRTRDGLAEVDYGDWTDKPLKTLRKRKLWPVIQQTPSRVTFPGGDSIRNAQRAVVEQLEALADEHEDADLLVAVSHADVIKSALAHFLGMPLDTFQRIAISPASVSVLVLPDGRPPLVPLVNGTEGGLPVRRADA